MPALFGYLVALSILLGGGYAGLQWLATPDPRPAVKPAAHSKNVPEKSSPGTTGTAAGPSEAEGKRNSGTPAKSASTEGSDKAARDAKATDAKSSGKNSKPEKVDNVPAGGCAPIGLTSNGDLVFSMQCQDLIERHRAELASTQPAQPAPSGDQAVPSAKPAESGKITENKAAENKPTENKPTENSKAEPPNNAGADDWRNDAAAKSAVRPNTPKPEPEIARSEPNEKGNRVLAKPSNAGGADGKRKDAAARNETRPGTANAEAEITRSEPNESSSRVQAKPSDHNRAGKIRNNTVRTAETKSNTPSPDIELAPRTPGPPKRSPRSKPAEMTSRTTEQPGPSREERSVPVPRPRIAARAETEWYNVLGLR